MESLRNTLRKLMCGLTLSYTAVMIGSLLVVGLILGTTLPLENPGPGLMAHSREGDWGSEPERSADHVHYSFPITYDHELISKWINEVDMRNNQV